MHLPEPPHQPGQHVLAGAGGCPHQQVAGELLLALGQLPFEVVPEPQHAQGIAVHQLPCSGRLGAPPRAIDQRGAGALLEARDLLADGRLGDAQRVGGGGERAAVDHLDERLQLAQIHE